MGLPDLVNAPPFHANETSLKKMDSAQIVFLIFFKNN